MLKLRDYQEDISNRAVNILKQYGLVYIAAQPRVGKTLTAFAIAHKYGSQIILFVTKKKAKADIMAQLLDSEYKFERIDVTNYEQLHNYENIYDAIIIDEAHNCLIPNTLIDGRKIQDINLGDSLNSFNFDTNKYEEKKVINIYKNKLSENLIKIKCNGKEIVCTESHKIYTKRGWVKASEITTEDELFIL